MSRYLRWGIHALAILCVMAAPVLAQVQTGSILVRVTDEQGAVLPGVTITISSPSLVAGQATAATDAGGAHRFPSLIPGTYTVRVELGGFQTTERQNVVVQVGQTTPVELSLKVAAVSETVTVTGESAVIDTTSANVNVTLSQQLLQQTPGGRDIWSLVEYKVPGLISSRPDVGGTSGGLQGAMVARGTPNTQNSQFLNGVNVGDPAAVGYAGYYYDYDAFDEIQVSTGAHDISVPASGVFLNMTTKTGSNRWGGKASLFWQGDATQSRNVDDELLGLGFKPDTNKVDFVSDVGFQLGGPLVKDKLRLFTSFRDWRVHVNVPAAYSESVLDETNMTSGLVNLTWQVSNNNRLTGFYSRQYYKKPNRFLASSALFTSESNSNEDDVFDIVQGLWNSVITNTLFMDARVSFNKIFFPLYDNGTEQSLLDLSTGIRLRNQAVEQIFIRKRLQASATFNYYIDQALGGRHELRFGFDHSHMPTSTELHRVDDVNLQYRSATNTPVAVIFYNSPVQSKANVDLTALFLQDVYTVKRLTLTGGFRWERLEAYLPAQSSPPSQWFPNLPREFDEVRDSPLWYTIGPRFNAIYDLDRGKTAIKFSAGRYYYIVSTGTANAVNPNFSVSAQYAWADNGDLVFQNGEQTGVPVTAGGLTTSFEPDIDRPYTDEFTAGVDRELIPALKLSAVFTYRVERYPQANLNTAAPLDTWVPATGADPGPDGLTGTADDGTYSYFNRTLPGSRTLITNDTESRQTYKGLEITATKRFSQNWQLLAGYTYSKARLDDLSVAVSPNAFLNTEGPIALYDRTHQLKISGNYVLPYDINLGANYRMQTGPPINRQIVAPLSFGGGSETINVEPAGSYRLDTQNVIDLRVAKVFRFGGDRAFEVDMDIFNLTNANTAWELRSLTGRLNVREGGDPNGQIINIQQWLSPSQILAPRIIRFSVSYRF